MSISNEIRTKLKRLSPYIGPFVPNSVKKNGKGYWGPDYENHGGWQWDAGSDFFQCELILCDLDACTCDPAGYVAIRPIEQRKYLLVFVLGFDPENLIFQTAQAAKRFLDPLLAFATPEVPEPPNLSDISPRAQDFLKQCHPSSEWIWCSYQFGDYQFDYPCWVLQIINNNKLGSVMIVPYRDGWPFSHSVKPKDWHDEWVIQFGGECCVWLSQRFLFSGILEEAKRSLAMLLAADTPE